MLICLLAMVCIHEAMHCTFAQAIGAQKTLLVIDSDGVVDDVSAISLALQRPDVLAITAAHGVVGVDQAVANIARALKANGKFVSFNGKDERSQGQVPVYKGADGPLLPLSNHAKELRGETYYFGKDGLGDRPQNFPQVEASDFNAYEKEPAFLALIRLFDENPSATLVCLGSLTNVALALKLRPSFAPKRVVILGGNYYAVGNVSPRSSAEFNFWSDPEAASIVLSQLQSNITIVPWEVFQYTSLKVCLFMCLLKFQDENVNYDGHLNVSSNLSNFLSTVTIMARDLLRRDGQQYAYCDEVAVATAIAPANVVSEQQTFFIHVELEGKYTRQGFGQSKKACRGQVIVEWSSDFFKNNASEDVNVLKQQTPIIFVTKYNVKYLDALMFETVRAVPQ